MTPVESGFAAFMGDKLPTLVVAFITAWVAVRTAVWRDQTKREQHETKVARMEMMIESRPSHADYLALVEKVSALDGRLQKAEYGLTHVSTDLTRIVASVTRIETLLMSRKVPKAEDD